MMDSEEFARSSRMDAIQTVENREQYLIDLGYETTDEVLAEADMDEFRLEFMLEDVLDYLRLKTELLR